MHPVSHLGRHLQNAVSRPSVAVFPLTKIASRNLVENMPGITLMSVELFNALYVAKCMQNAGSHATYAVILGVDVFESVMAYRDIRAQTEQLLRQIDLKPGQTLAQRVLELCLEPDVLQSSSICVRSFVQLKSTMQNNSVLDRLETISQTLSQPKAISRLNTCQLATAQGEETANTISDIVKTTHNKIWPLAIPEPTEFKMKRPLTVAQKRMLVERALGIQFQCEFHVLAEYVECIIPLIYALYIVILFHLPSVKYFTDMTDMTQARLGSTVISILTYAWLEVLSFIALHVVIKRNLGFSPACALGFVLETQFLEFQGRVVVWYLFLLSFTIYHCGT